MLRNVGIGVEVNRASVITTDMENRLWTLGILGTHSGQALLNAVSSITSTFEVLNLYSSYNIIVIIM